MPPRTKKDKRGSQRKVQVPDVSVLPPWSEGALLKEKWNDGKPDYLFEDPDGLPLLPLSLEARMPPRTSPRWLRPSEIFPGTDLAKLMVVRPPGAPDVHPMPGASPGSLAPDAVGKAGALPRSPSVQVAKARTTGPPSVRGKQGEKSAEKTSGKEPRKGKRNKRKEEASGSSDGEIAPETGTCRSINGFSPNEHDPFNVWLSVVLSSVVSNASTVPSGEYLWEALYPKGKDGHPLYNPAGKYALRVFVGGQWCRLLFDDRLPVDTGDPPKPVVLRSAVEQELWPLLLAKAVLKLSSLFGAQPSQDPALLHWLTGWMPRELSPQPDARTWRTLEEAVEDSADCIIALSPLNRTEVTPSGKASLHGTVGSEVVDMHLSYDVETATQRLLGTGHVTMPGGARVSFKIHGHCGGTFVAVTALNDRVEGLLTISESALFLTGKWYSALDGDVFDFEALQGTVARRQLRFEFKETREKSSLLALSAIHLWSNGRMLPTAGVEVIAVGGAPSSAEETVLSLLDDKWGSQWVDGSLEENQHVEIILKWERGLEVDAYELVTSASVDQDADPVSWTVFGRLSEEEPWDVVHSITDRVPPGERSASYGRLAFSKSSRVSSAYLVDQTMAVGVATGDDVDSKLCLLGLSVQHGSEGGAMIEHQSPLAPRPPSASSPSQLVGKTLFASPASTKGGKDPRGLSSLPSRDALSPSLLSPTKDFGVSSSQLRVEGTSTSSRTIWMNLSTFCQQFKEVLMYRTSKATHVVYVSISDQQMPEEQVVLCTDGESRAPIFFVLMCEPIPPTPPTDDDASHATTATAAGAFKDAPCGRVVVESHTWRTSPEPVVLCDMQTNTVMGTAVIPPPGKAVFAVRTSVPRRGQLVAFSEDPVHLGAPSDMLPKISYKHVRLAGARASKDALAWSVWFRVVIKVTEPTRLAAVIHLADAEAEHATRLTVAISSRQKVTSVETMPLLSLPPLDLAPPEREHMTVTLVAHCRSSVDLDDGRFLIDLVSDAVVKPTLMSHLKHTPNLSGVYEEDNNPHQLLFAFVIRARDSTEVSVHLSVNVSSIRVKVEVFDNGELLPFAESTGRGCATLPCVPLVFSSTGADTSKRKSKEALPKADEGQAHTYTIVGTLVDKYTSEPGSKMLAPSPSSKLDVRPVSAKERAPPRMKTSKSKTLRPIISENSLCWSLVVASENNVEIKADTSREDRLAGIKASWERDNSGRAAKSAATREHWLKDRDASPPPKPKTPMKSPMKNPKKKEKAQMAVRESFPASPPVLRQSAGSEAPHVRSPAEVDAVEYEHARKRNEYSLARADMKCRRAADIALSDASKVQQREDFTSYVSSAEEMRGKDMSVREKYRQRQLAEQQAAAELAQLELDRQHDEKFVKDKRKRGRNFSATKSNAPKKK